MNLFVYSLIFPKYFLKCFINILLFYYLCKYRGIAKAGEPNNISPLASTMMYMDPAIHATLRRKQRRLARENPGKIRYSSYPLYIVRELTFPIPSVCFFRRAHSHCKRCQFSNIWMSTSVQKPKVELFNQKFSARQKFIWKDRWSRWVFKTSISIFYINTCSKRDSEIPVNERDSISILL
jgi:hypothetical protein